MAQALTPSQTQSLNRAGFTIIDTRSQEERQPQPGTIVGKGYMIPPGTQISQGSLYSPTPIPPEEAGRINPEALKKPEVITIATWQEPSGNAQYPAGEYERQQRIQQETQTFTRVKQAAESGQPARKEAMPYPVLSPRGGTMVPSSGVFTSSVSGPVEVRQDYPQIGVGTPEQVYTKEKQEQRQENIEKILEARKGAREFDISIPPLEIVGGAIQSAGHKYITEAGTAVGGVSGSFLTGLGERIEVTGGIIANPEKVGYFFAKSPEVVPLILGETIVGTGEQFAKAPLSTIAYMAGFGALEPIGFKTKGFLENIGKKEAVLSEITVSKPPVSTPIGEVYTGTGKAAGESKSGFIWTKEAKVEVPNLEVETLVFKGGEGKTAPSFVRGTAEITEQKKFLGLKYAEETRLGEIDTGGKFLGLKPQEGMRQEVVAQKDFLYYKGYEPAPIGEASASYGKTGGRIGGTEVVSDSFAFKEKLGSFEKKSTEFEFIRKFDKQVFETIKQTELTQTFERTKFKGVATSKQGITDTMTIMDVLVGESKTEIIGGVKQAQGGLSSKSFSLQTQDVAQDISSTLAGITQSSKSRATIAPIISGKEVRSIGLTQEKVFQIQTPAMDFVSGQKTRQTTSPALRFDVNQDQRIEQGIKTRLDIKPMIEQKLKIMPAQIQINVPSQRETQIQLGGQISVQAQAPKIRIHIQDNPPPQPSPPSMSFEFKKIRGFGAMPTQKIHPDITKKIEKIMKKLRVYKYAPSLGGIESGKIILKEPKKFSGIEIRPPKMRFKFV